MVVGAACLMASGCGWLIAFLTEEVVEEAPDISLLGFRLPRRLFPLSHRRGTVRDRGHETAAYLLAVLAPDRDILEVRVGR